MSENLEQFPITTQQSCDVLNEKQLVDYRNRCESFIRWLIYLGKDPKMAEGYSRDTVRETAYRTDQFNRWVWAEENGYSMTLTHAHADDYMRELLYSETSATHKSNIQKVLKRYFNWIADEKDGKPWEPKQSFSTSSGDDGRSFSLSTKGQNGDGIFICIRSGDGSPVPGEILSAEKYPILLNRSPTMTVLPIHSFESLD